MKTQPSFPASASDLTPPHEARLRTRTFAAIAGLAGLSLILLGGMARAGTCCPTSKTTTSDVVAKGKGIQITRAELEKAESEFFAGQGIRPDAIPAKELASFRKSLLQGLVSEALLLKAADNTRITGVDEKVREQIAKVQSRFKDEAEFNAQLAKSGMTLAQVKENLGRQIRIQEALSTHVPKVTDPSAQEIEKYYNDHKASFSQPAAIRASHVLTLVPRDATPEVKAQKKKAIEAARKRVIGGEDFAKVAKEVSDDKASGEQGGDLGYFSEGEMVSEFHSTATKTKKGDVSPVFETPYGWHFMKVTDTKPASTLALEEVRPQIAGFLKEKQMAEGIQTYLKKLEQDAGVTYSLATTETTGSGNS